MIFLHYVRMSRHYGEILARLEDYIEQEARLFQSTQPHTPSTDMTGGGSVHSDRLAAYVAKKAELEEGRRQAAEAVETYARALETLRGQLMQSPDEVDKVFVARYIRRLKVHQVAARLAMSESTVYRILREIRTLTDNDSFYSV